MTFTEAALVVLKNEGRPMHSREITDKAVEQGILSHVGKTPVQTMSARLSAAVAKGKETSLFVRIRPGVFGLTAWKGSPPGPAKKSVSSPPPPKPAKSEPPKETKPAKPRDRRVSAADSRAKELFPMPKSEDKDLLVGTKREPKKEPVAQKMPPEEEAEQKDGAQPRKRRRKRRKKRPDESESTKKTVTSNPPHVDNGIEKVPEKAVAPPEKDVKAPDRIDSRNGDDLVEQFVKILRGQTKPATAVRLAEMTCKNSESGALLVEALLLGDGLDRESQGLRPRFVEHKNGFALAEREVSADIMTMERQVAEARERLFRLAERQVLRKVRGLPMKAFVQAMVVHLQRSGFGAIVPVDRSRRDEFHLSVQDRRHGGRFRTAVILRRDPMNDPISDRAVMDLRGSLHHYDATSGMIITTGTVGEQARAEALVPNVPPVALLDGEMLAREMVKLGIGVRQRMVNLPSFDDRFFTSLEM